MTQITISQWLTAKSTPSKGASMSATQSPLPRYQVVSSKKFFGHYDVLDTHTGKREAYRIAPHRKEYHLALNK